MGAESHSNSQPGLEKPPSTPEMSTHDAEVMANSMLLDSPLPNPKSVGVYRQDCSGIPLAVGFVGRDRLL